jgi:hypothetical protein
MIPKTEHTADDLSKRMISAGNRHLDEKALVNKGLSASMKRRI